MLWLWYVAWISSSLPRGQLHLFMQILQFIHVMPCGFKMDKPIHLVTSLCKDNILCVLIELQGMRRCIIFMQRISLYDLSKLIYRLIWYLAGYRFLYYQLINFTFKVIIIKINFFNNILINKRKICKFGPPFHLQFQILSLSKIIHEFCPRI